MLNSPVSALVFVLALLALIFGLWSLIGLCSRWLGTPPNRPLRRAWVLGVCADFSAYVGIPLWLVRLYALVYTPFILGFVFYFLYYLVMKLRPAPRLPSVSPETPVKVTRMDSYHY